MSEITYLTAEKLDALKAELAELKGKGRSEIAKQISEAREKGDLSENAEYDAAKDAQGHLEFKISKLETLVATARIIEGGQNATDKAYILSMVKVKNLKNNQTHSYMLVSEEEANIAQGKLSVKSPVGKAILGHSVGDVVEAVVPAGVIQFEILEIGV